MMMKSWGTRILLLYLAFVSLIAVLVYLSMRQRTDLVAEDYYARELAYQQHLDQVSRTRALPQPVLYVQQDGRLLLRFPAGMHAPLSGRAVLYCAADAARDTAMAFRAVQGIAELDIRQVKRGLYQLQLEWQAAGRAYYDEHNLRLP